MKIKIKLYIAGGIFSALIIGLAIYTLIVSFNISSLTTNIITMHMQAASAGTKATLDSFLSVIDVLNVSKDYNEDNHNKATASLNNVNKDTEKIKNLLNNTQFTEIIDFDEYSKIAKAYTDIAQKSVITRKDIDKINADFAVKSKLIINELNKIHSSITNDITINKNNVENGIIMLKQINKALTAMTNIKDIIFKVILTNNINFFDELGTETGNFQIALLQAQEASYNSKYYNNISNIFTAFNDVNDYVNSIIDSYSLYINLAQQRDKEIDTFNNLNTQLMNTSFHKVVQQMDTAHEISEKTKNISIFIIAVAIILNIIVFFFLHYGIMKPISDLVIHFGSLTSGNGDLKKQLIIKKNDELGHLSNEINMFIKNIREIIKQVKTSASDVACSNSELITTMQQLSSTFHNQALHAEDIVNHINSIADISSNTDILLDNSLSNLNNTTSGTNHGVALLNNVKSSIIHIDNQTKILSTTINTLSDHSLKIENIITTINEIAAKTNLLALNVSVESARAGEAGKGFAVVAEEIRKLAESTQKATSEIEIIIQSLQIGTNEASKEMQAASEKVSTGISIIEETVQKFTDIASNIEYTNKDISNIHIHISEQNNSMIQAGSNVKTIVNGIEESHTAVDEVNANVALLQKHTEQLQNIVSRFQV